MQHEHASLNFHRLPPLLKHLQHFLTAIQEQEPRELAAEQYDFYLIDRKQWFALQPDEQKHVFDVVYQYMFGHTRLPYLREIDWPREKRSTSQHLNLTPYACTFISCLMTTAILTLGCTYQPKIYPGFQTPQAIARCILEFVDLSPQDKKEEAYRSAVAGLALLCKHTLDEMDPDAAQAIFVTLEGDVDTLKSRREGPQFFSPIPRLIEKSKHAVKIRDEYYGPLVANAVRQYKTRIADHNPGLGVAQHSLSHRRSSIYNRRF